MNLSVHVALILTLMPSLLWCADWPQWRGPQRSGVADAVRFPDPFPATAPSPLWRSYVGEGYSGPVVQDGRVFIMGRERDGLEACLCFDAGTGKPLWRHAYVAEYKPPDLSAGMGPKSTPTVDREQVYMLGLGGMFHCLNVQTGRILWQHDCAKEFCGVKKDATGDDAWFPSCGYAASALVDGDHIILPLGGQKAGGMTAFERRSGVIAWKSLTDRGSYGSPIIADLGGMRQIVGFTGLRMVGLRADGGGLIWDFPFPAQFEQTMLTPVVWKDLVVFGGEKRPTIALKVANSKDGVKQSVAWQNADLRSYLSTPVVIDDHLVGFDNRLSRLVCVNLSTGKTAWASQKIGQYASLVVAGKLILALNSDGDLHVLEANPRKFVLVGQWQVSKAGSTWSHLAVAKNRLYIKDKVHLLCVDVTAQRR